MPPNQVLKYVLDIESIISELEHIIEIQNNDFLKFNEDILAIRAAERDLMIIGEAINQLHKIHPEINISCKKQIVGLRNLIVHSYDSVDPTVLWRILQKDVPILKKEIMELKKNG